MPAPLCAPKSGRTTSSSRPSWRASLQPSSLQPFSWQPLYNSFQGGSFPGDSPVNRWVSPPRHHDGNSFTAPKGALSSVASVLQKQRARDCPPTHHDNRRTSNLPTRLFKDANRASTTATILFGANSRSGASSRHARGPSQSIRRTRAPSWCDTRRTAVSTIPPLKMSLHRHRTARVSGRPIAIRPHTAKLYRVLFPQRMTECLR